MLSQIVSSVSSAFDFNLATLSGCIDIIVIPQERGELASTPFHVRFGKTKLLKSRERIVDVTVNWRKTDLKMTLGSAGEAYFIVPADDAEGVFENDLSDNELDFSDGEEEDCDKEDSDRESENDHDRDRKTDMERRERSKEEVSMKGTAREEDKERGREIDVKIEQGRETIGENKETTETTVSKSYGINRKENATDLVQEKVLQASKIKLSLCGHLLYGHPSQAQHDEDVFRANILDAAKLREEPSFWFHPSLVFRLSDSSPYLPAKTALPLLASWIVFGEPIPKDSFLTLLRGQLRFKDARNPIANFQLQAQEFLNPADTPAFSIRDSVAAHGPFSRKIHRVTRIQRADSPLYDTRSVLNGNGHGRGGAAGGRGGNGIGVYGEDGRLLPDLILGARSSGGRAGGTAGGRGASNQGRGVLGAFGDAGPSGFLLTGIGGSGGTTPTERRGEKEGDGQGRQFGRLLSRYLCCSPMCSEALGIGSAQAMLADEVGTTSYGYMERASEVEPVTAETLRKVACNDAPEGLSSADNSLTRKASLAAESLTPKTPQILVDQSGKVRRFKKSLKPSSEQLKALRLRAGPNPVTFSVSSALLGSRTVSGTIYLWPRNARIVVSDVDGTITRSDFWGQIMPIVGRDWTHPGVAELFSKIRGNDFKILYLTARAVGQADSTRDYIFGISQQDNQAHQTIVDRASGSEREGQVGQGGLGLGVGAGRFNKLPDGPLILSPDRLFPSFKREVIDRKPYVFKVAALRDIRSLFPSFYNPFYAGFGNRDTDHRAYVHIGIPEARIFIIDPTGHVHHVNTAYARSYLSMSTIAADMFPKIPDARDLRDVKLKGLEGASGATPSSGAARPHRPGSPKRMAPQTPREHPPPRETPPEHPFSGGGRRQKDLGQKDVTERGTGDAFAVAATDKGETERENSQSTPQHFSQADQPADTDTTREAEERTQHRDRGDKHSTLSRGPSRGESGGTIRGGTIRGGSKFKFFSRIKPGSQSRRGSDSSTSLTPPSHTDKSKSEFSTKESPEADLAGRLPASEESGQRGVDWEGGIARGEDGSQRDEDEDSKDFEDVEGRARAAYRVYEDGGKSMRRTTRKDIERETLLRDRKRLARKSSYERGPPEGYWGTANDYTPTVSLGEEKSGSVRRTMSINELQIDLEFERNPVVPSPGFGSVLAPSVNSGGGGASSREEAGSATFGKELRPLPHKVGR